MRKLLAVSFLCTVAAFIGGCTKTTNTIIGSSSDSSSGNVTWTIRTAGVPDSFLLNAGTVSYGTVLSDSEFIVFGAGAILSSPDGKSWVRHASNLSSPPIAVAWDSATFVGITDSGIVSTSDGADWTMRFSTPSLRLCAVTWGANLFVAVGTTTATPDTAYAFVSPDGITWSAGAIGLGTPAVIAWGDSQFTAVGNGVAYTSTDGARWSQAFTIVHASDSNTSIAYGAELFAAVIGGYSDNTGLYTSTDGINWISQLSGTWGYNQFNAIAWSGKSFIVAGSSVLTSIDGLSWTIHPDLPSGITIRGMAAGKNTIVALSNMAILTSP